MIFSQKYLDVILAFWVYRRQKTKNTSYQIFSIEIFFRFCVTWFEYLCGHPGPNPNSSGLCVPTRFPIVAPCIQFTQGTFGLKFYGDFILWIKVIPKSNPKIDVLTRDNDSISIEQSATKLTNKLNQDPLTRWPS